MESRSSLFGPSLEPVYYCTSVSVREKPPSYGQDSMHGPQFVVFSIFDQFFMRLIRLSLYQTKSYLGLFGLDSYLEFSSHYIQEETSLSANPHDHIEPYQIKEYSIICASYIRKERKELNHSVLL